MVKFLRLRPDAKRSDIIRVYNDTVMKLETEISGFEKKIKGLEEKCADLQNKIAEFGSSDATEDEV